MSTTFELNAQNIAPLLQFIATLDATQPKEAKTKLEKKFPLEHELIQNIKSAMQEGIANQTLCHRGEPPVQFSRVFKATEASANLSADAVLMTAPDLCTNTPTVNLTSALHWTGTLLSTGIPRAGSSTSPIPNTCPQSKTAR